MNPMIDKDHFNNWGIDSKCQLLAPSGLLMISPIIKADHFNDWEIDSKYRLLSPKLIVSFK